MANDGKVEIGIDIKDDGAAAKGKKAGKNIAKGVESGLKDVGKAANNVEKNIEKPLQNAAKNAKSSFNDVGSAAKSGFANVGDAAKTAANDASSAFQNVSADVAGSFSDVGSQAQSSFAGVADAANTASSDAASAFENIPADAAGAFSDVSSEAQSGFSGVADAANTSASDAASAFQNVSATAAGSFADVGSQAASGFSGVVDAARTAADGVNDALGTMGTDADSVGGRISEGIGTKTVMAGNLAADAIEQVASKALSIGENAMDAGTLFDKSMSQVAATMGKTTDEIGNLTEFAKEMGSATAFSASQASEALNYMALAGYDAQTSMEMLPTVLNLAAAGNMELATASDMVTDAQSALGLSLEETAEMVDKMAMASSKSNTSVEQLGNAFLTVGGTAKNLKGGTTELATSLGILADNGIKGAEGGTALRNIILSLSAPTDKAAGAIKDLGIEVFDAQGNMRGLDDIFNDFNGVLSTMSQGEQTQVLNNIFNKVDLKSVNALLANSGQRFNELSGYIDKAQGSAEKMAETQLDNLAGDMTLLESATEGLYIAISDKLSPGFRSVTQFATNSVMPALMGLVNNFDKVVPVVTSAGVAMAALFAKNSLANEASILGKAVGVTGNAFETMGTKAKISAIGTNALKGAMSGLAGAMPVIAVTALASVIAMAVTEIQKAQEHTEKLNNATKGLEDAASGLTVKVNEETGAIESLGDAASSVDLDEIVQQHVDLAKAISDTNQNAATSEASLAKYGDSIQELAGRSDLTETEVAKLKLAVDAVNEACGTSYEVVQDNAGAYQIMADGAVVAKDSVYDLIEAQKAQIRAQAEAENYKAVYEQLAKDQDALTEATKNNVAAEDALKNKLAELGDARYGVNQATGETIDFAEKEQAAYDETRKTLEEVQGQYDATQSSLNKLEEQQILTAMASEEGANALIKAADANVAFKSGVQSMNVDLVGFTKALQDMGFTSEQVASMSAEDAMRLAEAWGSGYDDMLAATSEVLGEVPQALQEMGAEAYEGAYGAGGQAGQGFSDGLSSEAQAAVDAAIATVGMTREEFDKLAEQAGIEGEEAAVEFAESIAAGKGDAGDAAEECADAANEGYDTVDGETPGERGASDFVKQIRQSVPLSNQAGTENADAATKGFETVDGETPGKEGGQEFAGGVESASGQAKSAGEKDAQAAGTGMQSQNSQASTWGGHLVQNFANGISSAISFVTSAASAVAGAVASILHFSAPKKGVWSGAEKGGIRSGLHLAENFADGMKKGRSAVEKRAAALAQTVKDYIGHSKPKKGALSEGEWIYGVHLVNNFTDGMKSGMSELDSTAKSMSDMLKEHIESMAKMWKPLDLSIVLPSTGEVNSVFSALTRGAREYSYSLPKTNEAYDSLRTLEKNGYTLDSYMKKMSELAEKGGEWNQKIMKGLSDSEYTNYQKFAAEVQTFTELQNSLTASVEMMREHQGGFKIYDDLVSGSNAAISMTKALDDLTDRGIALSDEFIEAFANGKDEYIEMLYDMEQWASEDIQAMSDYFRDLSYAEREAELAQRALSIQSQALSKNVFNVKGAWLDYYNTVLDVCDVISSNDGLNRAMQIAGINVNDLAADLQALDVSMNEFVQGIESFTSKVADGFSAMSSFGKTGLEDWQTNLKNNMAEAQQYAANLEKVFSNISPDIDSEAFRKAVYQGGFDKWAGVISDLAKSSASEIEEIVQLYNQAVVEGQTSALQQFEAVAPGEEYVAALSEAIMASSEEFTGALENCVDEGIDVLDDSLPEFESAGASMSGAIASGIDSQVSAIAASAAAAVRAALAAARAAASEGVQAVSQELSSGMTPQLQSLDMGQTQRSLRAAAYEDGQVIAQGLSDGMVAQFQSLDAVGQIQTSLTNGLGVMNMSAQVNGGVSKSFEQTNNYYAQTVSPDIIARNQRLDAMYGLAGQWIG